MDFPIAGLIDAGACFQFLVDTFHPDGLRCPGCLPADALSVHDRRRAPVLDYRCRHCGSLFTAYTGTPVQKTRRSPAQLVLILRGICQGTPTAQLARELGCDRRHLLALRHKFQGLAENAAGVWDQFPAEPPSRTRCPNAGKKVFRIWTRMAHPGVGPTSDAVTGTSTTTGPGGRGRQPGHGSNRAGGGGSNRPGHPDRVRDLVHRGTAMVSTDEFSSTVSLDS